MGESLSENAAARALLAGLGLRGWRVAPRSRNGRTVQLRLRCLRCAIAIRSKVFCLMEGDCPWALRSIGLGVALPHALVLIGILSQRQCSCHYARLACRTSR